jgi:cell shape-determining protein MreD
MSRARLVAAITAIMTALLLQATVVGPAAGRVPISLPAVLVAAVALVDGPTAGLSFGFAAGLVADLGSVHPAGVLALCWLGVGLVCGAAGLRRSWRRTALYAGVVCGLAAGIATLLLTAVHRGGSLHDAAVYTLPAVVADTFLAAVLVPLVRRMLRTDSLRAPHPVYTEIVLTRHG